jgi:hypothetical protein
MANFNDINQNLIPQLKAVITASSSLKANSRFKKLLEVELKKNKSSFRNYLSFFQLDCTCFWKLYEQ